MSAVRPFARFAADSVRLVLRGNATYWAWLAVLVALIVSGGAAYLRQLHSGLIVTAMRDQVSWGFYIGNFTFLVGVAAAAVVLVIPAYVYDWKPIREIVIIGEHGLDFDALLMRIHPAESRVREVTVTGAPRRRQRRTDPTGGDRRSFHDRWGRHYRHS